MNILASIQVTKTIWICGNNMAQQEKYPESEAEATVKQDIDSKEPGKIVTQTYLYDSF